MSFPFEVKYNNSLHKVIIPQGGGLWIKKAITLAFPYLAIRKLPHYFDAWGVLWMLYMVWGTSSSVRITSLVIKA